MINQAPILALQNLQKPFKLEIVASGYAIRVVLMQGVRHVQAIRKWKHYLMGKETFIHTNHQQLQYLQAHSKLQQTKHYKWMGFLQ
jgi:hypothetical protein